MPLNPVRRTLACLILLVPALAGAQPEEAYPVRPLRLVVGYPPGGAADAQARVVAGRLGEGIGQQVIVDNRPGAAGNVSADVVARSPADGYTVLLAASSIFAINPWLYRKAGFDVERDFALVGQMTSFQNVVVTGGGSAMQSMQDLAAAARAQPDKLPYGSPGSGTTAHIAAELFRRAAGVKLVHAPYKGDAQAIVDTVGGQLPVAFVNMAAALPLIRSGKLRALAVSGNARSSLLPEVRTMEELGYAGAVVTGWSGLAVRAGTPAAAIQKLSQALREALRQGDVRERFLAQAAEPQFSTPADFTRFADTERQRFGTIIREAGITAE